MAGQVAARDFWSVVPSPYHVVALANGKGGVGKTSITANVAAILGNSGYRVLVVELDPQGNCARDYGLPVEAYDSLNDLIKANGEAHCASLLMPGSSTALPPLYVNVRENVDLIAGGMALGRVYKYFAANSREKMEDAIRGEIVALGRTYDIILIDAPPVDETAMDAVLRVAGTLIIPTRADFGSIDGLHVVAQRFIEAVDDNPVLRLGGVVVFGLGAASTKISGEVQEMVAKTIGTAAPVFQHAIRNSDAACWDSRKFGLLAHELEDETKRAQYKVNTRAASSKGLADDYEGLAGEFLDRINVLLQESQEEELELSEVGGGV
ncbi:putative plasmid partitioning protein Soj/ParA family ATPase [Mycobacteroides abscessus subsp. abscessus]|uniref:ParA family protein n=1 Tax=Mycobacteroides abscessus TaxID=36809 RepID=UPI00092BE62B|nr:ParA family protein [Mycobacteroides abscessus]SIH21224.1 putative plasmid partitioning protein Soj/ParA family ATPase [Mycobacteroides abscessus subsp. abscessus]